MHRYYLLTLLLLLPMALHAQSGWYELSSGVTSTLYDVAFTSIDRGYAVGDTGTALRTTNGGQTWERMEMPSPVDTTGVFNRVVFTSELVGYIVGSTGSRRGGFNYLQSIILKTEDGGSNWRISRIDTLGELEDVTFIGTTIGYAVGEGVRDKEYVSLLYRTSDGGESWESLSSAGKIDHVNRSIEFRDTNVGMMSVRGQNQAEYYYLAMRTSDGGKSWERMDIGNSSGGYLGIHHVQEQTWLMGVGPTAYRTEDDGKTWLIAYSGGGWKFGFFNERVGYVVSGRESFKRMSKTIDGGMTWIQQDIPSAQSDLFGITSPALNVAYAVGSNGVILKTIDGGGTPVGVETSPRDDDRLMIDPVPSAGHVRCRYRSDEGARQLEIVDLLGQVVKAQSIAGGSIQTVIDTEGMSSGVYYCRLGSQTGVMVVVR